MRPELHGGPDDPLSRRLPVLIDIVVFVVAGVAGLIGDVGERTPLQSGAMIALMAAFLALGFLARRRQQGGVVAFAVGDVALVVALAAVHAPAGALALLIIGSSFRLGNRMTLGELWIFVLVDVVVLAIVLARAPNSDPHARRWVMELTGFFVVTLLFVQAVVSYASAARRAYAALCLAHEELRKHVDRVGEIAALRERERIALDIHDAIGHELTVLTLQLEAAALAIGSHPAAADVSRAHAGALRVLADVRQSVRRINADPLERAPLDEAIRCVCGNFQDGSGIALHLEASSLPTLPAAMTTHIVNIVREALSNATRHGRARSVRVQAIADAACVTVAIEDNGCGFIPDLNVSGHGLRGMRSRAAAVGATLEITSAPGRGSVVRMRVPFTLVSAPA
ncbi:MAG TPA: sensor histidine kinase [Candidatus Acidoferrum sp.]|nr:sensor histidine kinase [Candidatus Acidoferrum sp.]